GSAHIRSTVSLLSRWGRGGALARRRRSGRASPTLRPARPPCARVSVPRDRVAARSTPTRRSRPRRGVRCAFTRRVVPAAGAGCTTESGGGEGGGDGRPAKVDGIPTSKGTHKQKLDVGTIGHREYLLHVPAKVADGEWEDGRPAKPPALVIALHGGLATMDKMQKMSGFDELAEKHGFLVAYPNGFMTTWNAGDCCGAAKIGDEIGR